MKLEEGDLAPTTSPLVGFNSQPEWLIEKIILPSKRDGNKASRVLGAEGPIDVQSDLGEGLVACHVGSGFDLSSGHVFSRPNQKN
ncbi:hypothetical protein CsSME_00027425 [Camellia sinensis var. sinensis]